jgi:hypothetical protein
MKASHIQDVAEMLEKLPPEGLQEVRDFVEVLLARHHDAGAGGLSRDAARRRFIDTFVRAPLQLPQFMPLSRDEAHSR